MGFLRKLFGKKQMGRLVQIRVECPNCDKTTNAVLPDSGDERGDEPEIKCEHCKKVFKFTVGMPYKPIGYVT